MSAGRGKKEPLPPRPSSAKVFASPRRLTGVAGSAEGSCSIYLSRLAVGKHSPRGIGDSARGEPNLLAVLPQSVSRTLADG